MQTDHDSPWKGALDEFFLDCLNLLFPQTAELVAEVVPEDVLHLEQELARLSILGETSERRVDKIAKVRRKNGEDSWLWIHLEVQCQPDPNFSYRIFDYFSRLFSDTKQMPISMAILADDSPNWKPNHFAAQDAGCSVRFEFPVVKLLEFENRREELENSINPFAWLILAHLDTMATTRNLERRVDCKFQLAMKLGRRGLRDEQARKLFNLIDWMMQLPPDLDKRWYNRVRETQEANKMPFARPFARRDQIITEISIR
jgi:hypothetical protein